LSTSSSCARPGQQWPPAASARRAYRQLLVRDGRALSDRQWNRLRRLFDTDDPTGQIAGAWAGKELLRQLLVDSATDARPYEIRGRLERFYACAAQEDIPELTTLAATVETWWPEILGFLQLRITNERASHCTFNRGCGAGRLVGLAVA